MILSPNRLFVTRKLSVSHDIRIAGPSSCPKRDPPVFPPGTDCSVIPVLSYEDVRSSLDTLFPLPPTDDNESLPTTSRSHLDSSTAVSSSNPHHADEPPRGPPTPTVPSPTRTPKINLDRSDEAVRAEVASGGGTSPTGKERERRTSASPAPIDQKRTVFRGLLGIPGGAAFDVNGGKAVVAGWHLVQSARKKMEDGLVGCRIEESPTVTTVLNRLKYWTPCHEIEQQLRKPVVVSLMLFSLDLLFTA